MLVLSRKVQEQVCIGDNITLTILQVKGKTVRVGIEAPRSVRVVRAELPRKEDPTNSVDEESESKEVEKTQPCAVVGQINFAAQPTGGTNRLRDLVLQVTSGSATAANAI